MRVTLIQQTPNPIETISNIASICYDSDPADPMKLVKHLYKNGHHSVFEHIYFTFRIDGISRACAQQLLRHRHSSPTMRSQRYCSEDGFNYVYPESIRKIDTYGDYHALMNTIGKHYKRLVDLGVPKEDARFVLPNACDTVLVTSFNLRQLIHICNERLCSKAQWEIRQLVQEMVKLVDPDLRFMLVPKCKNGRIICHTPCNKKEN